MDVHGSWSRTSTLLLAYRNSQPVTEPSDVHSTLAFLSHTPPHHGTHQRHRPFLLPHPTPSRHPTKNSSTVPTRTGWTRRSWWCRGRRRWRRTKSTCTRWCVEMGWFCVGGGGGGGGLPCVYCRVWLVVVRGDGFVGAGGASCARRIRRRLNPFLYTRIMDAGQARLSSDPLHGRAQVLRQALPPLRRVAWCVLDVYVALIHRLIACQPVLGLPTDERFPIPPHPKTNQQARTPPTSTLTTPARPSARWRRCRRRCPPWRR